MTLVSDLVEFGQIIDLDCIQINQTDMFNKTDTFTVLSNEDNKLALKIYYIMLDDDSTLQLYSGLHVDSSKLLHTFTAPIEDICNATEFSSTLRYWEDTEGLTFKLTGSLKWNICLGNINDKHTTVKSDLSRATSSVNMPYNTGITDYPVTCGDTINFYSNNGPSLNYSNNSNHNLSRINFVPSIPGNNLR